MWEMKVVLRYAKSTYIAEYKWKRRLLKSVLHAIQNAFIRSWL